MALTHKSGYGYILSGEYWTYDSQFRQSQPNAVLLKLDELGCLNAGCDADEPSESLIVKIYPNPVNEQVVIEIPDNSLTWTVKMLDCLGRDLGISELVNNDVTLNLANYSEGLYFIQIYNSSLNEYKTYKIIVKH
ncbi:MAG TPA: T9SS type A sorting domain-containing protein [Bacteroidia bacterium]